jgi:HSP20 family protein
MRNRLALVDWPEMWPDLWDENLIPSTQGGLDLYEEGNNLMVRMEIPGFSDEDLDVTIEDNVLTVSGKKEVSEEEKDKKRKYYRREISSRSFRRSVQLPVKINASEVEASYEKGVLALNMPKAQEVLPTKVSVLKKK